MEIASRPYRLRRFGIVFVATAFYLSSCEKAGNVPIIPSTYPFVKYKDLFTAFWNGMNTRYVFWDIDTTNWDQMYGYQQKFADLDTVTNIHFNKDSAAYEYLEDMTKTLIDGHYLLQDLRFGHSINPSYNRKRVNQSFIINGQLFTPYFT